MKRKKLLFILVNFILTIFIKPYAFARTDDYQTLVDNVYIKKEVLDEYTNSNEPVKVNIYRNSPDFTFEKTIETINKNYQTSPFDTAEEIVDQENYENFKINESGSLLVNNDVFSDSYFIVYEKGGYFPNFFAFVTEALRYSEINNQEKSVEPDTPQGQEILALVDDHLNGLGIINDGSLTYQIYLVTSDDLVTYQDYYNQIIEKEASMYGDMPGADEVDKEFDQIKSNYEDTFVIKVERKIDSYNFYQGNDIGNVDAGTQVVGEEITLLANKDSIIESSFLSYYPIDLSNPITQVEKVASKVIEHLKNKYSNLIVPEPVYIENIETIYVPFPHDGNLASLTRKMEYQPMWRVTFKNEDDEGENIYIQDNSSYLYISVKDGRELEHVY